MSSLPLGKFRSLLHISAVLNANLDLHQLLPLIMLYSKDLLEAEASSLFLLDQDGHLFCEVGLGEKGEVIQQYARLELGEGIVGMVAKEKVPIAIEDAYLDPRFDPSMDQKSGFKTKSLICVPLFVEETLIGTLEVINKTSNRVFDSNDLEYLIALSEVAAIAIQNANTKDSLDKRILELSILYEFEKKSVSGESLHDLGTWLLQNVLEYLGAKSGTIYLANPNEKILTILAAEGIPKEDYHLIRVQYGNGIAGWVAEKKESLLIQNLDQDPRYNKLSKYTFESNSLITAPMLYGQELLGVISINNKKSGYAFNHSDLELLTNIATRLSSTIKNAQLFRQVYDSKNELNRAKSIMQKIMPRALPSTNRLLFGIQHIPLEQVGGDFYDVQEIEPNLFAIFVCDISGHGLSAAVLAAMAHLVLQNFEIELKKSPSLFLTHLNQILCGKLAGNFLTAFYGILDLNKNTLTCATAGHHPPLLLSPNATETFELEIRGKILGLIPNLFFEEKLYPFPQGTRMVLYTDGLTEHASRDRSKRYDDLQLRTAILNSKLLPCDEAAAFLVSDARKTTETMSFEDDVTLLIVDRQS